MGTALWPAGIAALSGLAGAGTGLIGNVLGARSAERLAEVRVAAERSQREHEVALRSREERRRFQHETLVSLQESVNDLARAMTRIVFADHVYGDLPEGEELARSVRQAWRAVATLRVRVRDESLRSVVLEFQRLADRATSETDFNGSVEAHDDAVTLQNAINERIGELLRELDAE